MKHRQFPMKHGLFQPGAEVLGCPIVGDDAYGFRAHCAGGEAAANGLYLAAVALSFAHPCRPETEPPIQLEINSPDKFRTFCEREQRRWQKLGAGNIAAGAGDSAADQLGAGALELSDAEL